MKNYVVTVNGKRYDVSVEEAGSVSAPAAEKKAEPATAPKAASGCTVVKAPMPGNIIDIKVTAGQSVEKGDVLLILEAMKMENEIMAPVSGTVGEVLVSKGDSVEVNAELISLN